MKKVFGPTVESSNFEYIMTVPAIWSDKAKNATMVAAEMAGMGKELTLVTEPEAAAMHTLKSGLQEDLMVKVKASCYAMLGLARST